MISSTRTYILYFKNMMQSEKSYTNQENNFLKSSQTAEVVQVENINFDV